MTYVVWKFFQLVWRLEASPKEWNRRGQISPIFKDGDKRDPLNYRGITLLSVVGKTFSSILNKRLMEWAEENQVLAEEQGGFRIKRGCIEQIFVLKEVIRMRRGKKTYCCFIDIKKAYDRVWRDGLWHKMRELGVKGKMWRMIREMYSDVKSRCFVGEATTDWFDVDVGVRQGCVLSPILFNMFINGLAEEVKSLGLGVKVDDGEGNLSILLYADDICLIAENPRHLQRMLDAISVYSSRWRFQINLGKTAGVVFGMSWKKGQETRLWYKGRRVEMRDRYKYLGMIFHCNGTWKVEKKKMIRKARRRVAAACSMLTSVGVIAVKDGLATWKGLIRPTLEYGCEVWCDERDKTWEEAERVQTDMLRRILRCGTGMAGVAVRGELGVRKLSERRDMLRLGFWNKVLSYPSHSWVRRVYMESRRRQVFFNEYNWCSYTQQLLGRYGLGKAWEENIHNEKWKPLMRAKVFEKAELEWREEVNGKASLADFARWKESFGCDEYLLEDSNTEGFSRRRAYGRIHLTRWRGGASTLRADTGRQERVRVSDGQVVRLERENRLCQVCLVGVEDIRHVLCDCPAYETRRAQLFREAKTGMCLDGIIEGSVVVDRDGLVQLMLFGLGQSLMEDYICDVLSERSRRLGTSTTRGPRNRQVIEGHQGMEGD